VRYIAGDIIDWKVRITKKNPVKYLPLNQMQTLKRV